MVHPAKDLQLNSPEYFLDRELSWLAFNDRVIEEAEDESTPILERLKFLGIAQSNLDEFFMVRVSGIQEQVVAEVRKKNPAGFSPEEHFERVHIRAHEQITRLYDCYRTRVQPGLNEAGIHIRTMEELTKPQRDFARALFDREVFPVLTPLAVDSGHPFPHLRNLSLNLAVRLKAPVGATRAAGFLFAVVQVPSVLDRLVRLPGDKAGVHEFMLLEELIAKEIKLLFPGVQVIEVCAFRLTRDADIEFAEEEADDLLKTIEEELRMRERGSAVRLGVEIGASQDIVNLLSRTMGLSPLQVYRMDGPINLSEVAQISVILDRPELKPPPFVPSVREPLRSAKSIFSAIARQDILVHHPFESFGSVVDFITQAAEDPNVLAIKQTLYRTSGDPVIIKALMSAAEKGKQVAALMELKARFDEERNIEWAKQMERAGVHVVYGLVGLKTHAKLCLVVRKENGGIRRYVHLGTGNYNPITARIYTDLGLFSCDPELCDDASELFNLLTGYSRMPSWRKVIVAPINLREKILEMIDGEIARAERGEGGRIRAKMNSLVDAEIIERLYVASCAGVRIDLLVRGICCLKPGIKGVSERITVSSIVDRFLEHSRIYIFGEGANERVFLSSADWMPRNLDRRVETLFPVEAPELKQRVVEEIFGVCMGDNVKRRVLMPDGSYVRVKRVAGEATVRAQERLLELEQEIRRESRSQTAQPSAIVTSPEAHANGDSLPIRPAKPAARRFVKRAIRATPFLTSKFAGGDSSADNAKPAGSEVEKGSGERSSEKKAS